MLWMQEDRWKIIFEKCSAYVLPKKGKKVHFDQKVFKNSDIFKIQNLYH